VNEWWKQEKKKKKAKREKEAWKYKCSYMKGTFAAHGALIQIN
jgi:hypothetical protein